MANINLSQSSIERKSHEFGAVFDRSLMISLGLIAVTFGTLFGLKMYNSFLENKAAALTEQISVQVTSLENDSMDRVVDFSNRSESVDKKLSVKEVSPQDMFALIGKLMMGGVSLDSYEYNMTTKTVSLKIVANDFRGIAQQVISFKSEGSFKSVSLSDISRGDDGSVTSAVLISL